MADPPSRAPEAETPPRNDGSTAGSDDEPAQRLTTENTYNAVNAADHTHERDHAMEQDVEDDHDDELDDVVYEPLASGPRDPGPGRLQRTATSNTQGTQGTHGTQFTQATVTDDQAPVVEDEHTVDDDELLAKTAEPGFFERIGLDVPTLMLMFKGSLPPIIGTAIFQADSVAGEFASVGYILPIITVLTLSVLPRGKFIQTLILNVFSLSVGAGLAMLILYSGVKARTNTASPMTAEQLDTYKATGSPPYNSSQSAVLGVWLFFSIWLINMVRAKLPAFNLPSIVLSIFINVACTTGPRLTAISQCETLVKRIYTAMLAAMAISAGVSLFVFPISSRQILFKQVAGSIGLMRKAIKLQRSYLRALERDDMYALATVETAVDQFGKSQEEEQKKDKERRKWHKKNKNGKGSGTHAPPPETREEKAAKALRDTISALRDLSGKMQQEVVFAKRDAAFGKLTAHDLGEIVKLVRSVHIPITGMSTIMDIFRRTAESRGWNTSGLDPNDKEAMEKERERRVWNEIMKHLHEPFTLLSEAIDEGLEHAAKQLNLIPKSKEQIAADKVACKARKARKAAKAAKARGETGQRAAGAADAPAARGSPAPDTSSNNASDQTEPKGDNDVEATAGAIVPGDAGFAAVIDAKVRKFTNTRSEILRIWARERGLLAGAQPPATGEGLGIDPPFMAHEHRQSQLYVLLYMEQLMVATGQAVQDFVHFADNKVQDGTMDRTRFLFPTLRRLYKWLVGVFSDKSPTNEDQDEVLKPNFNVVFIGDGFNSKKDPEHLPAKNAWQKFGNGLRAVSRFLGSSESAFGMRAACATMTVGVVCYLENTQRFFLEQRLVWAMIMVALGMTQTSGQSIFGFACRVFGSFVAMVVSYIVWYIVDEKTAGAIVMLWLFIFIEYYFLIKYPRFIAATIITIITQVLIVAYELQVRKIGIQAASASGQRYYPTYELAPYRLATVAGGCAVAFFWTIFPRPTTDRAWLRRDLSATLYLLGNYFSVINETLKTTLHASGGNPKEPGTPSHKLAKVRQKLFMKLVVLIPSLQNHSTWQRWEPTIGGEFPRAAYEDIILRSGRIFNYLTLIMYTVTWKRQHSPEEVDDAWISALAELIRSIGPTHYTILSTLTLLSNSLLSGHSLPPYIPLPRPYELTRQLLALKTAVNNVAATAPSPGTGSRTPTGESSAVPRPSANTKRRRSSIFGKASWRPDAGSHDVTTGGGLYERLGDSEQAEAGRAAFNRPTWGDVSEQALSTATGESSGAPLERMATKTRQTLGSVLDARNMEQHGYTEFAVLQVCSTLVCDDLEGMIQTISGLVGVVDFSFKYHALDDEGGKGKDKAE